MGEVTKEELEKRIQELEKEKSEKISELEQEYKKNLETLNNEWLSQKLVYENKISSLEKSIQDSSNMDIDGTLGVIHLIIVYLEVLKRGIKDKKMNTKIKELIRGNPSFGEFIGIMEYIMEVDSDLED